MLNKGFKYVTVHSVFVRKIIVSFLPPIFQKFYFYIFSKNIKYAYGYSSWVEAENHSSGYQSKDLIEKSYLAAKLVEQGNAAFERDGYIFHQIQYSWPFLSSLLASMKLDLEFRVLDWGGGFGSSFVQSRKFLDSAGVRISWHIVELPDVVKCANESIRYPGVRWYADIDEIGEFDFDVVLCSASINYTSEPYLILHDLIKLNPRFVIIDRLEIASTTLDQIAVQINPRSLHGSSYPVWILAEGKLLDFFSRNSFKLIEEWDCSLSPNPKAQSKGYFFQNCAHT